MTLNILQKREEKIALWTSVKNEVKNASNTECYT